MKDKLLGWFIRNLLNRLRIINIPGFLLFKIQGTNSYGRQVLLPEDLVAELEERMRSNSTELYSLGKKFGYNYVAIQNIPTISKCSRKKFLFYTYFLVRSVECVYADRLKHKIDYDRRIFRLKMKNYIICRKNGLGYIFSMGGIAGVWAYIVENNSVEAVKPECEGRGARECLVIAAPYKELLEMGYEPITCKELESLEITRQYIEINRVRTRKYARYSLESLINSNFISYKHGQMVYRNERFFLVEASFLYTLEKELAKIENGLETLWQCSFNFGRILEKVSNRPEPCKFIMDFIPALGFGDILALKRENKYEIIVYCFPWTKWYKDIDFTLFRALLSGIISEYEKKEVRLENIEKEITEENGLSLYISES